jgi:hypothetical protein
MIDAGRIVRFVETFIWPPTHCDSQSTNATFAAKYYATFVAGTVVPVKYGVKHFIYGVIEAKERATNVAYWYFSVSVDRERGGEIVVPPP